MADSNNSKVEAATDGASRSASEPSDIHEMEGHKRIYSLNSWKLVPGPTLYSLLTNTAADSMEQVEGKHDSNKRGFAAFLDDTNKNFSVEDCRLMLAELKASGTGDSTFEPSLVVSIRDSLNKNGQLPKLPPDKVPAFLSLVTRHLPEQHDEAVLNQQITKDLDHIIAAKKSETLMTKHINDVHNSKLKAVTDLINCQSLLTRAPQEGANLLKDQHVNLDTAAPLRNLVASLAEKHGLTRMDHGMTDYGATIAEWAAGVNLRPKKSSNVVLKTEMLEKDLEADKNSSTER